MRRILFLRLLTPEGLHLLFGRCVSAEAAADLAALLDLGLLSTFPAADAALAEVTSLFLFRPAIGGLLSLF